MFSIFVRNLCYFFIVNILFVSCNFNRFQDENIISNLYFKNWKQHQRLLFKIINYRVDGIFSYFSDKNKIYAHFNLEQVGVDNYKLSLSDLFGYSEIQLRVNGTRAELIDNTGKHYVTHELGKMIFQVFGLDIPLSNLHYWIIGLPGDATDYQVNNYFCLKSLNYIYSAQKWSLKIKKYDFTSIPLLPIDLELEKGKVRIVLRINKWNIGK